MQVFVPLCDDALDALSMRGMRLVPYRCGLPLQPGDWSVEPAAAASPAATEPPPDPLSAAA